MRLSATARFTPRNGLGQFIPNVITPGVIASVTAAGNTMRDTAKGYAPVLTGDLRDSIESEVTIGDKSATARVTVGVPYAAYPEFGTGRRGAASPDAGAGPYNPNWPGMAPTPYMRPAMEEMRQLVVDIFRSNISIGM